LILVLFALFGRLGDGKTLSLTYLTFDHWFNRKEKIFANYHLLKIPYYYIKGINHLNFPKGTEAQPAFCLNEDQFVLTFPNIKKIKDVKVGENIITGEGRMKEIKYISTRQYKGEMLDFKTRKINLNLKVTPEHSILIAEKCDGDYNLVWKKARDIKRNDFFVLTRYKGKEYKNDSIIDECIYCGNKKIHKRGHIVSGQRYQCVSCRKSFIERYKICINKLKNLKDIDLCYILGLFFADGHANIGGGKIRFAVQKEHRDKIKKCLERFFGSKTAVYDYGNFFEVTLHCRKVARIFNSFGKNEWKSPPLDILRLPIKYQKKFLEGYVDGDGHKIDKKLCQISTISKDNLFILMNILFNLGIIPSISSRQPSGFGKKEIFIMTYSKNYNNFGEFYKNYILLPISEISSFQYDGMVYNLNIEEDETFLTFNATVHNCALDEIWRIINARTPMAKRNQIVYDILGRSRKRNITFCFTSQLKRSMDKMVVDVLDFISKPSLSPDNEICTLHIFAGSKATMGTLVNVPRFITAPFMKLFWTGEEIDMTYEEESEPVLAFQVEFNEEHGWFCECEKCGTKFFKTWEEAEKWAEDWWENNWKTVLPDNLIKEE